MLKIFVIFVCLLVAGVIGAGVFRKMNTFTGSKKSKSVASELDRALETALGVGGSKLVHVSYSGTKGLIKDGELYPLPGGRNYVHVQSNLSKDDIKKVVGAFFFELKKTRDETYVPVEINFYEWRQDSEKGKIDQDPVHSEVFGN